MSEGDAASPLVFEGGHLLDPEGRPTAWPALAVLGDPVAHSASPRLHQAALRERGIDADYAAVRVRDADLAAAVHSAAAAEVRGLNLTVPHKETVLEVVGAHSEEVTRIGAGNTLARRRGRFHLHNTDARGLALALQRWRGRSLDAALEQVVVIGAGGAARAAVACVEALGARRIVVAARRPEAADWARERNHRARLLAPEVLEGASLLLQCTPLGLDPEADPSPLDLDGLDPSTLACDLTYADRPSAFLREVRARGAEAIDGMPMLIAQAALAFSMWYGAQPPLEAMARAVGRGW